jgi:membrane associated rhomboid family serine protease
VSRYAPSQVSIRFGPPGPLPQAVRTLIIANVVVFVLSTFVPSLTIWGGLTPAAVFEELWVWQPVTYMFLHGGLGHILFNMLALWMFGVDLERTWGTQIFVRYYFITGVGAAVLTLVVALLPFGFSAPLYFTTTVGASGAIYGLLLAYALYYPDRIIFLFLFPVPARYAAMILGGIALYLSVTGSRGGVAHLAHLGGLVIGYLYLTGGRGGPLAELKYRYLRWKVARMRKRFDVHQGGRGGWDRHVH